METLTLRLVKWLFLIKKCYNWLDRTTFTVEDPGFPRRAPTPGEGGGLTWVLRVAFLASPWIHYCLRLTHTECQWQCQCCHFHWNILWRLGMGLELIFKCHHVTIDQHWPLTLLLGVFKAWMQYLQCHHSIVSALTLTLSSGGSMIAARGTCAPGGPDSFNFMQFLGKFGKIVYWRPLPPPESWRPNLGEILDAPLLSVNGP